VDDIVTEIGSSHDVDLQVLVMSGSYIFIETFLFLLTSHSYPKCSDEVSPQFWEEVRKEGWFYIDHTMERTLERFGEWYPPLIDVVAQSYAVGFVGTEDSTFSLLGQRRVESWNGGVTRSVDLSKGI
jgi:hypothetical protein